MIFYFREAIKGFSLGFVYLLNRGAVLNQVFVETLRPRPKIFNKRRVSSLGMSFLLRAVILNFELAQFCFRDETILV